MINVRLIEDGFDAHYVESGHIVYGRGNTLFAAPFDLERLAITGPSVPVVENVCTVIDSGVAGFSVARDGTLAYFAEVPRKSRTLIWVDRTGKAETLPTPAQEFTTFPPCRRMARRMAVQVSEGAQSNIFVYEFAHGSAQAGDARGGRVATTVVAGRHATDLRRAQEGGATYSSGRPWTAAHPPSRCVAGRNNLWPGAWTPDGQALAFVESPPTEVTDIKMLRRGSNPSRIEAFVAGRDEDLWPGLSPERSMDRLFGVRYRGVSGVWCDHSPVARHDRFPPTEAQSRAGPGTVEKSSTGRRVG